MLETDLVADMGEKDRGSNGKGGKRWRDGWEMMDRRERHVDTKHPGREVT